MVNENGNRGFRKIGILTIVSVYVLIMIGGIVRSTGSGMGCPDWPKCFGKFIPPTNIGQLPENYQDIYAHKRYLKNVKVASMLSGLGFDNVAHLILNDSSIYEEAEFNAVKTWIEYLNRLAGVVVGFLIILVVVYSFPYIRTDKVIFFGSVASLLLVLFEGWLGSIVVSTNLLPFSITIHMGLAVLLVILLIYLVFRENRSEINEPIASPGPLVLILGITLSLSIIQILIGTQVREQIDIISASLHAQHRHLWIGRLDGAYTLHKISSVLLVALHLLLFIVAHKRNVSKTVVKWSIFALVILLCEVLVGIGMNFFSIPAFLQPVHLVLATLLIGVQFYLIMVISSSKIIGNTRKVSECLQKSSV